MTTEATTTCATCGRRLPETADALPRTPCPSCGSTARNFALTATVEVHASATARLDVIPYPQRLLESATAFIEAQQYGIAVVVAHTACEIAMERKLSELILSKGIDYLQDWIARGFNGYNPSSDRVLSLYETLTGDRMQQQPFWQSFRASVARRNGVVHTGAFVDHQEALDSHAATSALVAHLHA